MLWHVIWTNDDPNEYEGVLVTEIVQGTCVVHHLHENDVWPVVETLLGWFEGVGAYVRSKTGHFEHPAR